jgi:hypothetical protein
MISASIAFSLPSVGAWYSVVYLYAARYSGLVGWIGRFQSVTLALVRRIMAELLDWVGLDTRMAWRTPRMVAE